MLISNDINFISDRPTVVALGTFDGVHLGHRAVIGRAVELARAAGIASAVFAFSDLPKNAFLPPEKRVFPLCTPGEKARLIASLGADMLIAPPFTREIASIPAADFVSEVLIGRLRARHIVCGEDHRFGAHGAGDTELLKRVCRKAGIGVAIVPPVMRSGRRISSTDIRALLDAGRIEDARALLGHEV